jgi:hypothetical protein
VGRVEAARQQARARLRPFYLGCEGKSTIRISRALALMCGKMKLNKPSARCMRLAKSALAPILPFCFRNRKIRFRKACLTVALDLMLAN